MTDTLEELLRETFAEIDAGYDTTEPVRRLRAGDYKSRAVRWPHRKQRRSRGPRLRQRWSWRPVVAAVAVAAVVAVALAAGLQDGAVLQSALAKELNGLAQVAAGQAWTGIPGPGQYLYTSSVGSTATVNVAPDSTDDCTAAQYERIQMWQATDGSGAQSNTRYNSRFTSPSDAAACARMGIHDPSSMNGASQISFRPGMLTFPTNDWRSLSTDPATLLTQVPRLAGGPNTPQAWFTGIGDLMRFSDTPPAIRAALFHAAELIPGVKALGIQQDPLGSSGPAVGYFTNGKLTAELFFYQNNGMLLADKTFDASTGAFDWTVYQPSKIVSSHPNYPLAPVPQTPPANPPITDIFPGGIPGHTTSTIVPPTTLPHPRPAPQRPSTAPATTMPTTGGSPPVGG